MPKVNRADPNKHYVILFIHFDQYKFLDLTTPNNVRNYRYSLTQKVKTDMGMRSEVCRFIKNHELDATKFRVETLENVTTGYTSALERIRAISNHLKITSPYTLSCEAMEIKQQMGNNELYTIGEEIQKKVETYQNTPPPQIKEKKHPTVMCECGKYVLKCNMSRHRNSASHKFAFETKVS